MSMKIVEYYKKPERRMAGVVVTFSLIVMAVLFILKTIGSGTDLVFPDWLCHVLWLGGSWALFCVVAAMFLYPLRYFIPFREKSLAEAFEAGFKTLFALLFVALGVLFLFGDVLGIIEDGEKRYQNDGTEYQRFADVRGVELPDFARFMIPNEATDVRIFDKPEAERTYHVSCTVGMREFMNFAKERELNFDQCANRPYLGDDCILRELNAATELSDERYLRCRAKWDDARLDFVYDVKRSRLYSCYDIY